MKKFFCSKWGKTLGLVALMATVIPSLVIGAPAPVLDGANLYKVANKDVSDNWGTSASAKPGQTLSLMVHLHNGVIGSTATNVRAQATLPSVEVKNFTSRATVSATGVPSVSADVSINLSETAKVEYIKGSTSLYGHTGALEGSLPDGITSGGINVLNTLNGCWEYEKWVIFKVRIVEIPKVNPCLCIVNFHDLNGNGLRDANESLLTGWQFKVTGNGVDQTVTVDADGCSAISGLKAGTYTVTEILQTGWVNTTPLVQTLVVEDPNECTQFIFGNKKICEDPNGCEVTPPEALPQSGPGEMIGLLVGSMSIAGGTLSYARSKKNLSKAILKR